MIADFGAYELLAQAFLYPTAGFGTAIEVRARALPTPCAWAQALAGALSGVSLEDLQVEHVRLFVNAYGGAECLPYESVYAEGQVLGEVAQQVAATYAEWGVEQTAEMPDHAAVELAFAAHLAHLQRSLELQDDRAQVRRALETFEYEHLRAWLPTLAANLQQASALAFYRALGAALQAVFGASAAPQQGAPATGRRGRLNAPAPDRGNDA